MSDLRSGDGGAPAPLASRTLPPVTRAGLALYAGASGDHNPVHIDLDAARAAGLDDVIAHGMLSMAWAGRVLEEIAGPGGVLSYRMRFAEPVRIGETLTITVRTAADPSSEPDGDSLPVDVLVEDAGGRTKARGGARLRPAVPAGPTPDGH
ncbi:MaoC like domain-containing protein [Streptomyces sp. yr375]|uniref:MaoC/PaaZ C-terminal domain-containing protein n=1 Tax=Streptomyces sp. yr375 TaxID=1761906 RepID=UPI0006924FB5|nr:MaoC/PaaZ C-terminal domain-containing protein [Streptomyces sp. yr375]SES33322.1 MaoC like domain-containing protein [Streptomyces sp. yr375]